MCGSSAAVDKVGAKQSTARNFGKVRLPHEHVDCLLCLSSALHLYFFSLSPRPLSLSQEIQTQRHPSRHRSATGFSIYTRCTARDRGSTFPLSCQSLVCFPHFVFGLSVFSPTRPCFARIPAPTAPPRVSPRSFDRALSTLRPVSLPEERAF